MTCWKISHLDLFSSMIFPLKRPLIVDFPMFFYHLFIFIPWISMVFPQFSHDIPSKVGISGGYPVTRLPLPGFEPQLQCRGP
jgi:hypothetical protein